MVRLSSFDVYPKTLQEFRERTLTGAVISLVCAVLIVLLAGIELADFLTVKKSEHLFVDTSRGKPLQININITFPALPCSVISLDTLDVSGNALASLQNFTGFGVGFPALKLLKRAKMRVAVVQVGDEPQINLMIFCVVQKCTAARV